MTFKAYEEKIKNSLAKYIRDKNQDDRYTELILGLYEEAGEITSLIRRTIKGNYHETNIDLKHLAEEVGDVLWYITHVSIQLPGVSLQGVAEKNLEKIKGNDENKQEISIKQYSTNVPSTYREEIPAIKDERLRYFCLGLIKEAGEVSKIFGEHRINGTDLDTAKIEEKLGDCLWYLTAICDTYELDLEQIAKDNIEKVYGRYKDDGTLR